MTSRSRPAERVVVRADERLLLDALLPPGSDYCQREPVFAWRYDLAALPVTLTVAAAGQETSLVLESRREVTVTVDDEPGLDIRTAPA